MGEFKKTLIKSFPRQGTGLTPDNIYWKNFQFPVTVQEFGSADFADFSADGSSFAVTASAKVKVYDSATNAVSKCLSKFSRTAYGGRLRADGRLLCAGSDDAGVRVYDVNNKHLLRHFHGHERPVHRCAFTSDGFQVASFSDDRTVALWDVGAETRLHVLEGHTDYVRAGTTSAAAAATVVSGGYDHQVRVWDTRSGECTVTMTHQSPVEALLVYPAGGLVVSAGGTEVRVWDLTAGGRLLSRISQHTKTVTCLWLCTDGGRLASGSLDRRVKLYDTATYKVVHTLEYPSPVLSLAIAPDDSKVVVGMADGLVSIRDRKPEPTEVPPGRTPRGRALRHKSNTISEPARPDQQVKAASGALRHHLEKHDQHLRRFEFSRALDAVLEREVVRKRPERTVSLLAELQRRGALRAAVAGRQGAAVRRLCTFLSRQLSKPRFTAAVAEAAVVVADVYSDRAGCGDPDVDLAVEALRTALDKQMAYLEQLWTLQGSLDMLLTAAADGGNARRTRLQVTDAEDMHEADRGSALKTREVADTEDMQVEAS